MMKQMLMVMPSLQREISSELQMLLQVILILFRVDFVPGDESGDCNCHVKHGVFFIFIFFSRLEPG